MRSKTLTTSLLVLVGCLFFISSASAKVRNVWLEYSKNAGNRSTLQSLNLADGTVTTWRTIPDQGQNSDGITPAPENNHVVYYKKISQANWGIYLSTTRGTSERLLATGFRCIDGPCDINKSILLGWLSPNGTHVSYRKNDRNKHLDVQTGTVTVLPWKSDWPVTFSPKMTYVMGTRSNRGSSPFSLRYQARGEKKLHIISVPLNVILGNAFSPDERYIAAAGFAPTGDNEQNETQIFLIDVQKHAIVDQLELPGAVQGTKNIVWLSNTRFAIALDEYAITDKSIQEITVTGGKLSAREVYVFPSPTYLMNPVAIDSSTLLFNRYHSGKYSIVKLNVATGNLSTVYAPKGAFNSFALLGPKR